MPRSSRISLGRRALCRGEAQRPLLLRAGTDRATALLLLAGTAVADFAVHEALETHQVIPGRPVWDPHDSSYELAIEVHWQISDIITQGWPVMKRM